MTPAAELPNQRRLAGLPGWELVSAGVADLTAGRESIAALLVASASTRLAGVGVTWPVVEAPDVPERLFLLIAAEVGDRRAHGRYNALRRRLASFLRAVTYARPD
jgi:hypothetical protein